MPAKNKPQIQLKTSRRYCAHSGEEMMQEMQLRLRTARNACGLTQRQLAELTGLKTAALSHFECGRQYPSIPNLVKLADALTVTTDWLLGRSDLQRFSA